MPYDPATNPLNQQEWIFPFLEVIHISCFAMSVGLISVVNLRLAGVAFPASTAVELSRKLSLWILAGITLVLLAGMMIFTTDPYRYSYNPAFQFKMLALLMALIYQYTVHRIIIRRGNDGTLLGRASAVLCTALWVSVVYGGIFYAFVL